MTEALARALYNEVPRSMGWNELSAATRERWVARAAALKDVMDSEQPKSWLVDGWQDVLKRAHSIKLAVAAPFVIEALWYVLSSAPPELRMLVSLPAFLALAALAVIARLWRQK